MVNLNKVYAVWECPNCEKRVNWSYMDLADRGNPVCDCGDDMELIKTTGVVDTRE